MSQQMYQLENSVGGVLLYRDDPKDECYLGRPFLDERRYAREFSSAAEAQAFSRQHGIVRAHIVPAPAITEIHDLNFPCPQDEEGVHSIGCGCEA